MKSRQVGREGRFARCTIDGFKPDYATPRHADPDHAGTFGAEADLLHQQGLNRALRHWTGLSPGEWRRQHNPDGQ